MMQSLSNWCILTGTWIGLNWQTLIDKPSENQGNWDHALITFLGRNENKTTNICSVPWVDKSEHFHIRQTESWDCGIACLLMIQRWLREQRPNSTGNISLDELTDRDWILKQVNTESIWSIDLVHILEQLHKTKKLNFRYLFASKVLEVDQHHKNLSYYEKSFSDDQTRVTQLFQKAQQESWPLIKLEGQLDLAQVASLVSRPDCVAIALVDNTILTQKGESSTYVGHYIIISGVYKDSENCDTFQIHNPDSLRPLDHVTFPIFEKAWRAQGTDEDIIFLIAERR